MFTDKDGYAITKEPNQKEYSEQTYLGDTGSNDSVVCARDQILVQDTRRATISCTMVSKIFVACNGGDWSPTNSDHNGATQSNPGVINGQGKTANAPNAVLPYQLIRVSRCIDFVSFQHTDDGCPCPFDH